MRNSKSFSWTTALKLFLLFMIIVKAQISMDIDIDEGDSMTSTTNVVYKFSLITNRIDAGTKVQVKIPYQLNMDGTSNFASLCKEAVYRPATNSIVNNTLTTCTMKQYTTFAAVEFTVGQAYTGISMYYFYLGYFKNPRSVQIIDSFEVSFSNGFPTGTQTTGLVINYTPNKIYQATLINGDTQAGTKDTYQFSFKITNDIPRNGFLRLRFPSPWNSAPSNIQALTSSIRLYGSEKAGTYTVLSPITSDVIYGGLFDLQGLTADSTKTIQVTLSGIENPNYMVTTGSFQISTLDDAKQVIDQIQTGLIITINRVGTLAVNFTIGNTTVDTATYLQLSMESSAAYSSGGYIEIQAPAQFMNFSSTVRCNTIFGLTGSSQNCSKLASNIVRFQRDISNKAALSISIENLVMPLGVIRNSAPFKIYLKDAGGQIVSQNENVIQFTTQPGNCWMVAAIRNLTTLNVGNPNAMYLMNFTCGHKIPARGSIIITIPDDMITFSSTMECSNINGTKINCRLSQNSTSTVLNISSIDMCKSQIEGCQAFELLSLSLQKAVNPLFIVSPLTSSIQISTYNSQFDPNSQLLVDQMVQGAQFQNQLRAGVISQGNILRVGAVTGSPVTYTFTLKTQSLLPNGAALRITFPVDTAFLDSTPTGLLCTVDRTTSRVCTPTTQAYDSSVVSSITIQNFCSNAAGCIAPANGYTIDITQGLVNPFSNKTNIQVQFKFETLRSHLLTNLIDIGTAQANPLILTPNSIAVSILQPISPILVGSVTTYRLELKNTVNMLPSLQSGGKLEIIFPTQLDLQTDSCQAQTSTNIMLDCNGFSKTNKVIVTSNFLNITKGSTILVTFVNNVRNPQTSAISNTFQVITYFQSSFVVDQNLTSSVQADTFNLITSPQVKRDSETLNQVLTSVQFVFGMTNSLPQGGMIKVTVPDSQMTLKSASSAVITPAAYTIVSGSLISTGTGATTFSVVWCLNPANQAGCSSTATSTNQINFNINGQVFQNPSTSRLPDKSIEIQTFAKNGIDKIDSTNQTVNAQPLISRGALINPKLSRSNNIVGQSTMIALEFKSQAAGSIFAGSRINVIFPPSLVYQTGTSNPLCQLKDGVNTVDVNCVPAYLTDALGQKYLKELYAVIASCSPLNCNGGTSYNLTIDRVTNAFNNKTMAGQSVSIATMQQVSGSTTTFEVINCAEVTTFPDLFPGIMAATRPVRSQVIVDRETTIDLGITLTTRLEKGGFIKVLVPKSEFQLNDNIPLFKYLTGTNAGTTQALTVFEDSTFFIVLLIKENCATGLFCAAGTTVRFQITSGISNLGWVQLNKNSTFEISTLSADGVSTVDNATSQKVTPDLQMATIEVLSVTQSTNQASAKDVTVDFQLRFGASVAMYDKVILQIDDNSMIRKDDGDILCFKVTSGSSSEQQVSCNAEPAGSSNVNKITVLRFCSIDCDATSIYTLRLKNVVNKLTNESYIGNITISTVQDIGTYQIGQGNFSLSRLPKLIPGQFKNVSITRSSTFQGQNADFTITFTTPGYLLQQSVLELSLPKNQIAQQIANTDFIIKSGGVVLSPKITPAVTQNYTTYIFDQWVCKPVSPDDKCGEGLVFSLQISNAANPFVQSSVFTDPFIIQIRSPQNNQLQFNAVQGLLASPSLEFGKIENIRVNHANSSYVLRTTEYIFNVTVQSSIPAGGKVRVTFPANRVLKAGTAAMVCKVNEVNQTCLASFVNPQTTVTITGICNATQCSGPLNLNLWIAVGIKNPSTVTAISGNFTIETLSSSDFVVSQGTIDNARVTQVLPEPFTTHSVQRSSLFMMADSDYRVSFQIVNAVPQGGFFRVIMPVDQVQVPSSGPTCKLDVALTSLTCRIIQRTQAEVWIDINSPCGTNGCTAGQTINLLLQGMTNPAQFVSNFADSSWKIYTMNSAKELIDGVFTGVRAKPDLIGKQAVIQAIQIDQPFVGRATFVKIGVIPGADMTNQAVIDIYFPDNMFYQRTNDLCATSLGGRITMPCSYVNYNSGYVNKVSLMNPCSQGCSATSSYFYEIPVYNRGDNYPYVQTLWRVIVRYPYVDVSAASVYNSLTIQPEVITKFYLYNNGQYQIDAETPLYVSFRPVNYIPTKAQRGRIRVIFPDSVRVVIGLCQIRVDNVQQSDFQCSFNRQVATITHNYQSNLIGRNITLDVKTVTNPNSTKPSEPFQIITEWDVKGNGVYYRIDQNVANVTWQATVMTQLIDSEIVRLPINEDQSGYRTGQPTQLQIYIKLRHKLDSTSNILVTFPASAQLSILPTASKASSCFTIDQGGRTLNQLLCEVNQTTRTVTVRNYCQVQSCNARDDVRFKLLETFVQNYHFAVSPLQAKKDSVVITTTTKEGVYYFDTVDSGLFVKPDLQPTQLMMPSPEILRTNNIINKRVSWVFSFKTNKNPVPQGGYLNITLPKDVLIPVQNSSLDILNYDNGARYWNVSTKMHPANSSNNIQSVKEIIVWNLCNASQGCLTGASYSFQIDWIRNPLSQIVVNQPILLEMRTQQGFIVERGTTQPVSKLFSELIPARLQNLQIRAVNPEPSQVTDYEVIFSADAEFSNNDVLSLTLPSDFNFTLVRQLQANSTSRCTQLFTGNKVNCTINKKTVRLLGVFTDNSKQYGVKVTGIVNPNITGPSQALIIEVANAAGQTIASRSTLSRVNILEPIDQSTCNQVCGACSGSNSTCTRCSVPSKYPLFKDGKCVDTCGSGFFFDQLNLRCTQCSHACETCHSFGDRSCLKCAEGYLMEDGQCKTFCSKTLLENPVLRACSSSYRERCSSRCLTCSLSPDFCLSCDPRSAYPVLDKSTGKCIPRNPTLCGPQTVANGTIKTTSNRFYIDKKTNECKICSELCKSCEDEAERCTQCWNSKNDKFQARSIVNELYDTCVEKCGLGTYYDQPNNTCKYCNPVCLTCTGQRSDQCQVCNKTPEARQLYLLDNKKCVISCPKSYNIDSHNSTCIKGEVQVVSFSFLFLFSAVGISSIIITASLIQTRCKNKTVDIFYAIISLVEFINRLCLLGNLFIKSETTGVFPLSVCFMNVIATSSLGLFFNLLFMTPISAHSPHFRKLLKLEHRVAYQGLEWLCYLGGVNAMRLASSGFMGLKALSSDLNEWRFFTLPLNMMSNYTLIFTVSQLALDVFVVMYMAPGADDAFVLGALGLGLNTALVVLQLFKHLTTTRAQEIEEDADQQSEDPLQQIVRKE